MRAALGRAANEGWRRVAIAGGFSRLPSLALPAMLRLGVERTAELKHAETRLSVWNSRATPARRRLACKHNGHAACCRRTAPEGIRPAGRARRSPRRAAGTGGQRNPHLGAGATA